MQGRTTAAQPVLSQRVERRQSVSRAGYFADLLVWCFARIIRQEWVPVDANCSPATQGNAFEAINHDHRVSNQPILVKEEDPVTAAHMIGPTGERYRGPRGTLLSFRKPKASAR